MAIGSNGHFQKTKWQTWVISHPRQSRVHSPIASFQAKSHDLTSKSTGPVPVRRKCGKRNQGKESNLLHQKAPQDDRPFLLHGLNYIISAAPLQMASPDLGFSVPTKRPGATAPTGRPRTAQGRECLPLRRRSCDPAPRRTCGGPACCGSVPESATRRQGADGTHECP